MAVLVIGGQLIVYAVAPSVTPTPANLALFYVGVLALSDAAQRSWLAWRTRRLFARQQSFQCPYEFAFDESGVKNTVDGGSESIAWANFLKWRESATVFLLYRAEPLYQMVPKHAFAGAKAIGDFRRLLRAKIAERPSAPAAPKANDDALA